MKKAADLRAWLTERVPFLRKHPDRLLVFIERGAIAARLGPGMGYEYRYDVVIGVTDYADHPDSLAIPLLAWIAHHQPDLMQHPDRMDQVFKFQAELIDHEKADLEITISLTESVIVTEVAEGVYSATHVSPLADPPGMADFLSPAGPTGWTLYGGDLQFPDDDAPEPAP